MSWSRTVERVGWGTESLVTSPWYPLPRGGMRAGRAPVVQRLATKVVHLILCGYRIHMDQMGAVTNGARAAAGHQARALATHAPAGAAPAGATPAGGAVASTPAAGSFAGVRQLDAHGGFTAPAPIAWAGGRFVAHGDQAGASTFADVGGDGGTELWLLPGLVDAHVHAAWHAFTDEDRAALSAQSTHAATAEGLARTLAAGITSVRDAGGLTPGALAGIPEAVRPEVQVSVRMLDRAAVDSAGGMDRAVAAVLAEGAQWVKLVGTAGVASPVGSGLESVFTRAEVTTAVERADAAGAAVMVHAWGGAAIDHAISAGAASIEHCIFLTPAQAHAAAAAGMTLVPTLRIYALVQRMIAAGALPSAWGQRVDEAVAAHPNAVRIARDAGLPIAVGTDSGTPEQHATAGREVDALVTAGLSPGEALLAATRSGAALLARARVRSRSAHTDSPGGTDNALHGTLRPGARADAVLLRRDPREPGALSDPTAVVQVLKGGAVVPVHTPPSAAMLSSESSRKDLS